LPCLALAALAACDYLPGHHHQAPASHGPTSTAATHVAQSADPLADMVAAVSLTNEKAPIGVKFALRQQPEIGQPTQLDLVLVPASRFQRITVSFHADDGLAVSEGAHWDPIERPEVGVPLAHSLTLVPGHDGIFNLTATVLTETDTDATARTFLIPLVAGTGFAADAGTPAAAPAATGTNGSTDSTESPRTR
jgi:hypothetical protein